MNNISRPVLVHHPDPVFRERVRRACSGRYEYVEVPDWGRLLAAVREAPPAALVVVDPYEGAWGGTVALSGSLRSLLQEFPSVTVVAAFAVRPGCYDDLRVLGEWGVTRVLCVDEEDSVVAVRSRLASARGRPLRNVLQRTLPPSTSGRARAILVTAADVVSAGGGVRELARTFRVTTRTLLRWNRRAGLLPPRELLAWMRILLAAELLDDPGRSVLGVALACGYSSDTALRNVTRRYMAISPRALREGGAFAVASGRFLDALRATQVRAAAPRGMASSASEPRLKAS